MNLNWNKNLFFFVRRKRKNRVIGHDIFSICRSNGKFIILDGLCISIKSNKHFLLTSTISLRRKSSDMDSFFINFPIFLSGALTYKIVGLTYGHAINCSKLINVRLKK